MAAKTTKQSKAPDGASTEPIDMFGFNVGTRAHQCGTMLLQPDGCSMVEAYTAC